MNFKILNTPIGELLLRRDLNESDDTHTTVHISAYIDDLIYTEEVLFNSEPSAKDFIENYNAISAEKWINDKFL